MDVILRQCALVDVMVRLLAVQVVYTLWKVAWRRSEKTCTSQDRVKTYEMLCEALV